MDGGALGLIATALTLGFRHGFDWDHLAAITDVTSTTATAEAAESDHEAVHERVAESTAAHEHAHDERVTQCVQGAQQQRPSLLREERRLLLRMRMR